MFPDSRPVAAALWLAVAIAPAQAATTLEARQTNVFGNFAVGSGSLLDTGSFSELLSTLDVSYGQSAADAGGVNGVFNGNPVSGSASFASEAGYGFDPLLVVGHGAVVTTGETPYSYVSLGSNAISSVRLTLELTETTVVTLSGSISSLLGPNVGARASLASASVSMNGLGSWSTATHQGGFLATRTVLPGFYEIRGSASSALNGEAAYSFDVALAPVPEPSTALLLAFGGLWLLRRRARAGCWADLPP